LWTQIQLLTLTIRNGHQMHQITLTVSQNVLTNHVIHINNNFTACVQTVRYQHARVISDSRSLRQAFLQVTDVTNLCFVHALLHNTPNFIITCPFRWSIYDTFDAIFFDNISHCNNTFSLFRLSQGSEATLNRWGGLSSYRHMYRSSWKLTAKTSLKSADFSRSYRKNKYAPFHGSPWIS